MTNAGAVAVRASTYDAFELRSIEEWAADLVLDTEALVLAGLACGKWWFASSSASVFRRDIDQVEVFLRSAGLMPVLFRNEEIPCAPTSSTCRVSREADIERIVKLIDDNEATLIGHKWKWFVGELLRLVSESRGAMRVIRDRGILVADVEEAIRRCPRFASLIPADGLTAARVIGEMKRLHTMRSGYLWLNQEDPDRPYVSCLDRRPREEKVHAREFGAAQFAAGEIVWVGMEEVTNGRRSRRKHPALLISLTGHRNDKWMVVSLTSEVEGDPQHRRVPEPERLGLCKAGYVWHEVQKVHFSQIESHIGWATRGLVRVVDSTVNLRQSQVETLNEIADRHHSHESELMFA